MARRRLNHEALERRANEPGMGRVPAKAHRGTRVRFTRSGQERVPHVVPTDRDRESFSLVAPGEMEDGYQTRWTEHRE